MFANACRRIYGAKRVAFCRTVAYVELEEGPRILTNVGGGAPDDVSIGAAVHAHFDHASDDENGGGAILLADEVIPTVSPTSSAPG